MIRVRLPYHLQTLAGVGPEVRLEVASPVSAETVLNALEEFNIPVSIPEVTGLRACSVHSG